MENMLRKVTLKAKIGLNEVDLSGVSFKIQTLLKSFLITISLLINLLAILTKSPLLNYMLIPQVIIGLLVVLHILDKNQLNK